MAKKSLTDFQRDIHEVFTHGEFRGPKSTQTQKFKDCHIFRQKTRETYESRVQTFATFVFETFQVTDARFLKPKMAEFYVRQRIQDCLNQGVSVSTLKVDIHSLMKYQNMLRSQKQFRARIIDAKKMLQLLKKNGLRRSAFHVKKENKITEQVAHDIIEELRSVQSINSSAMQKVLLFQLHTGARISAAFRLQTQDIDFDTNMVKFVRDKGNKTRTVHIHDQAYMNALKKEVAGKSPGRPIFEMYGRKGNLLSIDSARRTIERHLRNVVKKIDAKAANTHSFRKVYAQNRYNNYLAWSPSALRKALAKQISLDSTHRIKKRINKVTKRHKLIARRHLTIDSKMRELNRRYHQGERLNEETTEALEIWRYRQNLSMYVNTRNNEKKLKGLSKEEMAALLTSLDLGHARLDVLVWYIQRNKK